MKEKFFGNKIIRRTVTGAILAGGLAAGVGGCARSEIQKDGDGNVFSVFRENLPSGDWYKLRSEETNKITIYSNDIYRKKTAAFKELLEDKCEVNGYETGVGTLVDDEGGEHISPTIIVSVKDKNCLNNSK
jgi:hypothetical protein